MRVIPALDLLNGEVVRLFKGNYNEVSHYSPNPLKSALKLKDLGFNYIHIVDLSGAKAGHPVHFSIIKEIIAAGFRVQVGGGIRTHKDVESYLSIGAERIILGTQAILNPAFWKQMVTTYNQQQFALSLDLKGNIVATQGWIGSSQLSLEEALNLIGRDLISHLIVTDVSRDGTMSGVNLPLYQSLKQQLPNINIIPAGGFSSIEDYHGLKALGIAEAIVGKALFENEDLIMKIKSKEIS